MIKYKKSQIIPRWSNIKANDRKAQHCLKFGADVSYESGTWYLESEGSLIVSRGCRRVMSNGTVKVVDFTVTNVNMSSTRMTSKRAIGILFPALNA